MKFAPAFLTSLVLATSTLAAPSKRDAVGCSAFPVNGKANVPRFKLQARYANSTTVPLVLTARTPSLTLSYLATAPSVSSALGDTFTMVNSGIVAPIITGNPVEKVSVDVADSNAFLEFTSGSVDPPPAEDYCEVVIHLVNPDTSPNVALLLAVNGTVDKFSICKSSSNVEELVVYNAVPTGSATGYESDTCEKVSIEFVILAGVQL